MRAVTGALRAVTARIPMQSVSDDAGNFYTEAAPNTWVAVERRRPTKITCTYHDGTCEILDADQNGIIELPQR